MRRVGGGLEMQQREVRRRVVARQIGDRGASVGELDLDTFRRNTVGKDAFTLTVTPVGGASCSVKVTLR